MAEDWRGLIANINRINDRIAEVEQRLDGIGIHATVMTRDMRIEWDGKRIVLLGQGGDDKPLNNASIYERVHCLPMIEALELLVVRELERLRSNSEVKD